MSELYDKTYNPDVLSCLANLSNDEVFTPPEVANQMLDMLPKEIWSDPNATFLDPACKSGVFLREIAKRLIKGLEDEFPDLDERLEHIFKKQLHGVAITELTSLLSRRSVYCSKYPNSRYSVVEFDSAEGNVRFKRCEHDWYLGKCKFCGVPKAVYDRSDELETYAYEFIHAESPKELLPMKFDVVIGNPPYQMNDGGGNGSSAMPIYQKFIEQAEKLNPRYLAMIVPAKWQSGGKGLDNFRANMLADRRMKKMVTYSDSRDCFQGVDIAGGVTYFLWERQYNGLCETTLIENNEEETSIRQLDEFPVFIPSEVAVGIIRKVRAKSHAFYDSIVRARNPYSIGAGKECANGDLKLRYRGGMTTINSADVSSGKEMINEWKVIVSKAAAEHAGQSDRNGQRKMLTVIEEVPPKTVSSETYLVVDSVKDKRTADNLLRYIKTKFVRYLIWQATPTQNISKGCFMFVPDIDLTEEPTDMGLYRQFELTEKEIEEIERKIKPHGQVDGE